MINTFEGNQEDKNTCLTLHITSQIIEPVEICTQLSYSLEHSPAALTFLTTFQIVSLNIYFESRTLVIDPGILTRAETVV